MIHHLARALAVREQARACPSPQSTPVAGPRSCASSPLVLSSLTTLPGRLRIRRDPADARRTVIAGRFADVCAALDRMAAELEAA